jgi:predicted transcriptional regulator
MLTKVQMVEAIQSFPDDATVDDAIERLYVLAKIEIGLAQADAGKLSTQEEARQRMAKWLR